MSAHPPFSFELQARSGRARAGLFHTPHGVIETPCFMPVGTQATVRAMTPEDLRRLGAQIVLGNTFHLYLRPGPALIRAAGGLHAFMAWDRPILTDSGGFQVFSLAHLRKVDEEGVVFRSPFDGGEHRFTPESVIEIEAALGADVIMPLDVCVGYPCETADARLALERTMRWLSRSVASRRRDDQALFGIVQGAFDVALRREAAARVAAFDLPGVAIGGLSVGEPHAVMYEILDAIADALPADRPRYLMGIGAPHNLAQAVGYGVDLFDCALPTRVARTGVVFTRDGRVNLRNRAFAEDMRPLDPDCACEVCRTFSRAYVRHLFKTDEMLGPRLATFHNLHFLIHWTQEMREAILGGRFNAWQRSVLARYATSW